MLNNDRLTASIRNSYYPVYVAQSDDPDKAQKEIEDFLAGHITLKPWIPYSEWDAAVVPYEKSISKDIDNSDDNAAIQKVSTDKITINHADRYAKVIDFARAEFDPETKAYYIDRQLNHRKLVTIYQPVQFYLRLASVATSIEPDYLILEAKELRFTDELPPIEYRDIYEEDKKSSLEHQIRIALRYMANVSIPSISDKEPSIHPPEYLAVDIGDLHDICGILDTDTMITRDEFREKQSSGEEIPPLVSQIDSNGDFHPADETVKEQFLMDAMNKISLHAIGGFYGFAGNMVYIRPTNEWIARFRTAFPAKEWNARTFIETVPDSGVKSDRLAFHCIDKPVTVTILTNRVEIIWFYKSGVDVAACVEKLIPGLLKALTDNGVIAFCHMQYRICAEVAIPSEKYERKGYHAEFSEEKEGLTYNHMITLTNETRANAFGYEEMDRIWQYAVFISTPADENILWYKSDDAISYFLDARKKAEEYITVMKTEDPVKSFSKLMQ